MISLLFKELKGIELKRPFAKLTYEQAMNRFGSDKPDMRFGLELCDFTDILRNCQAKVFTAAIQKGGVVKGIRIPNGGALSRKDLDDMTPFVATFGARGVAWTKITAEGWQSPIAKFLSEAEQKEVERISQAQVGDVVLFSADSAKIVHDSLGNLRLHLGEKLGLIPEKDYALVWVVDFPLMDFDPEEKRYVALHHPFTAPLDEDLHLLDSEPAKSRSKAYDLAMNGMEVGGGSIRIHQVESAKENSRPHGHRRGGSAGQVRLFSRSVEFRRAAPWRHRLRYRSLGDAFERRQVAARCHSIPQKPAGGLHADRSAR